MSKVRILIVEDELIVAEDIRNLLKLLGYEVAGIATSYDEAERMLSLRMPDMAIVDIKISGKKDGIELAEYIRYRYHIAILFLSSHAEKETVERAKKVHPDGYLLKPFKKKDLYTAIEIALSNFNLSRETVPGEELDEATYILNNSIFIKKDFAFIKVHYRDIKWIQAFGNYLILHCNGEKHTVRSTFRDMLDKLPEGHFMQVHRSFAVNLSQIKVIRQNSLVIENHNIPIGRTYLDKVKKELEIKQ
ncbi:MAG: response regulator transcription factor [Chlorobi bacterium]|nr:response regulator transcription factor [Chlorobiota bacterium]